MGKGVKQGHDMGEMDMRSIAPLLAQKLGINFNVTDKHAAISTP